MIVVTRIVEWSESHEKSLYDFPNYRIFLLESNYPIVEDLQFFFIEFDLTPFIVVLLIMRHLGEVDRGIFSCEGVVSWSWFIEGWTCDIVNDPF